MRQHYFSFPGDSFTAEYLMNTTVFPEAQCVEKKSMATMQVTPFLGEKKKRNEEDEKIAKNDTHFGSCNEKQTVADVQGNDFILLVNLGHS